MEGKGTPKNEQNQFCHSPAAKGMTPSEVERQDSHAAGVKYSLRDLSPSLMRREEGMPREIREHCRGQSRTVPWYLGTVPASNENHPVSRLREHLV